jgi:integrase
VATKWKRAKRKGWIADYRDASGVRHRLTAKTREAADALLADRIADSRDNSPAVVDPDLSLATYAARWFAHLEAAASIKPRTIQSYLYLYSTHIAPKLGAMRLRDLHRVHLKDLLAAKHESGLAKNTVRLIRATLSTMLAEAMDDGLLKSNPAALPSRRRGHKGNGAMSASEHAKAIRPFSEAELARILSVPFTPDCGAIFLLLARTGMRPGEALALKWSDLDFSNRKILVERAISAGQLGTTKTDSIRTVDMSHELATSLAALYKLREAETLRRGWSDVPEWVFINREAKPLDDSRVRKQFARAMKQVGVSGHRLYDLRHTFATMLLAKGAPITYVSAQLGHAKPTTTLQHYAHWLPQDTAGFVDRLDTSSSAPTGPTGSTWHQFGTNPAADADLSRDASENAADLKGFLQADGRNRTVNLLITNQLLCR